MARPRKSDRLHQLGGTFRQDRHGLGRDEGSRLAVGDPPSHLKAEHLVVWSELVEAGPWLGPSDRHALELAVLAICSLRSGAEMRASMVAQVGRCLDRLGLSPGARGELSGLSPVRVDVHDEVHDDPLAEILRRKGGNAP